MTPEDKEIKLLRLNYTQQIAENYNETGQKVSELLQQLTKENLKHETIIDEFLDFANQVVSKLNKEEQVQINDFVKRVTELRITANNGVKMLVQLLNDQNELTKDSTETLKKLLEEGM
ncbi:hypothetical protein [Leptobacterium sp. I13]|uniref:hypothetical protein n=1 Tax=Leptobacterium meishanense TaxID=3128904 RepID=UPI0030EBADFE